MAVYTDIKQNIVKSSLTGIVVLEDISSVQQALSTLIKTKKQELTRFELPYFGSNVHRYLMEKISPLVASLIEEEIRTAIDNYEPRVEVIEINVESIPDQHIYDVYIKYKILSLDLEDELQIPLSVIK